MRAWIHVLDAPGYYKRTTWAERKFALQGSGLIRTTCIGPCAQSRVPRAIATARARDALSNDRCEIATRFERLAKQALALAIEPQAKREAMSILLISYLSVVDPVAMFEQSKNVAIAHIHLVSMTCILTTFVACHNGSVLEWP